MKTHEQSEFTERIGRSIVAYRVVIIAVVLVLAVLGGYGMRYVRIVSSVSEWFAEDSRIRADRDHFEAQFKKGEIVALLVSADDVFTHRTLTMIDDLSEELVRRVPFADRVVSITNVEYSRGELDAVITEELVPDEIPRNAAELERLREIALTNELTADRLVSEDSTETWVVLELLPFPEDDEAAPAQPPYVFVGRAVEEIVNDERFSEFDIKSAGTPILYYDELIATNRESIRLVLFALITAVLLLVLFLRSIRGVVVSFFIVIASVLVVYGLYGYMGTAINAFLFNVPVFLAVAVAVSYSVHMFNYYDSGLATGCDRKTAVVYAIRLGARPLLFSALTTAVALASFVSVGLVPLRWLGVTGALIVCVVYLLVFLLVPAVLSFGATPAIVNVKKRERERLIFSNIGAWTQKRSGAIVVGFAIAVAVLVVGIARFEVNLDLDTTYGFRVDYINRLRAVAQSRVGSFSTYDVTFDLGEEDAAKDPDALVRFGQFIDEIETLENTKRTSSVLPLIQEMHRVLHGDDPAFYTVPSDRNLVAQVLFLYEMSGGDELGNWISDDYSVLRLQVETRTMDARLMMRELDRINDLAERYLPAAEVRVTGSMFETAIMNQYVGSGQIRSFLIAVGVIALLMVVVLRSVRAGVIGLIPNLAPAITIAGLMGFLSVPLDVVTVTIAPLILGIAVDNTIHLLTYIERGRSNGQTSAAAIEDSLVVVGRAIVMTTLVVVFSFGLFGVSYFNMMRNLGVFMALGITVAAIAGLLVVPALAKWVDPFGRTGRDVVSG